MNINSFSSDNDGSESSESKSRHRHRLLRHGLTLSEAEAKSQNQGEKKKSKREVQDLGCVIGELNVRCTVAQLFNFTLKNNVMFYLFGPEGIRFFSILILVSSSDETVDSAQYEELSLSDSEEMG